MSQTHSSPSYFTAWMCKQARRELVWTYSQLAHNSGCSIKLVRDFETTGEAPDEDRAKIYSALKLGGLERLEKFAKILGCEYPITADQAAV